jgi:hypothetical protein
MGHMPGTVEWAGLAWLSFQASKWDNKHSRRIIECIAVKVLDTSISASAVTIKTIA